MSSNPYLVETDWLFDHLDDANLSIVDASWYLPTMLADGEPRNGRAEFESRHIPGAVYFDIDAISQSGSNLPHTLASPEIFAKMVGELGISNQDTIVVYDGMGLFSAARAWWNFRIMGAENVVLLNGGLPKWIAEQRPTEAGKAEASSKSFDAEFKAGSVVSFDVMSEIVGTGSAQIADARPGPRFTGEAPEPRAGMRSGHMPGALSVPFSELAKDGQLRSAEELSQVFEDAGVDLSRPLVTTCGSGVTAAALTLALETIGHTSHKLYDGSWSEWGSRDDTPVVTDT
ncbi:MAG: 3-mercaptopyruvate sulfurtransferase [Rhizobiaceae bacterium]|nr:3-mercaptopyruvate sulfurtransferase [Rhizobiaceae bacterium]